RGRAPRSPQGEARVHGGGDQPRDHTQDGVRRDAPQERGQDRDRATHGGRVAKPPPLTQPSPLRREGSRCIGGDSMYDTSLWLGGKEYKSRLIVGTGKYPSFENMREAIEASGAEIVTVAVRRVNLPGQGESLLDYIDTKKYTLLPNTAGCYTAD